MRCESVTSGRCVLFASGAKSVAGMVRGDACTWHGFGSAAYIERAFDRLRVVWGLWGCLVVWCVCCGGGTGLVGDWVCCLDASIVRRTLESWTVLCAACTRPPSDVAFRGAMRAILRGGHGC